MLRYSLSLGIVLIAAAAGVCLGGDSGDLDWTAWRHMPAFGDGRVVPVDTFARETVEAICGVVDPTLVLADAPPHKFASVELLLSWLVEPDKWEKSAFLAAADPTLRKDVLGLPLFDADGRRLRYASPDEVENNVELGRRWAEMQKRAETEGSAFHPDAISKNIRNLVNAYARFRILTFDPNEPKITPRRFYDRVRLSGDAWRKLAGDLQAAQRISRDKAIRQLMVEAGETLQKLITQMHGGGFSREKTEPLVAAFRRTGQQLADRLTGSSDKPLAALAAELRRQTAEMHLAMYDNGETLRLVPALNPGALEANRSPGDDAAPWLSFQALMYGSADLLRPYPQPAVKAVRRAFDEVKAAYLDRAAADRTRKFSDAMSRFAEAVRALAQQTEPLRERLPLLYRDQSLIDATAYPPPGSTDAEVFYNRFDPFLWSWIVSLAATLCLLVAVGPLRRMMFWLGACALATAQAFTTAGFGLRMDITGLVPLTGMFETVVFVALCVALLGLWFALLPLLWPGLRTAWRLTALPNKNRDEGRGARGEGLLQWVLLLSQAGLMIVVFLVLARYPEWLDQGLFDLLPPSALGAAMPSANEVLVWLAGLGVLLTAVYYLPRAAVTAVVAVFTISHGLLRHGVHAGMERVLERRLFALAGAVVSFVAVALAYYAPAAVMHRGIGSAAPILRDNFWLVVHVVTITASYGSAAIALILGNVALGYYLFGRYVGRRPPEACAMLAGFTYTAIRITVLLLAAGTILGALWADKAWGRFWAWDPKEVWALISLLVYVVILHARYIGWAGSFGMALAAVLGATSVLFTWYGVNYLLGSGMHSYASGAGGAWQVGAAVALNWLFLAAAAVRYRIKTGEVEFE